MAFFKNLFSIFKKNDIDDYFDDLTPELEDEEAKEFEWDWETLVKDRHKYKLSDDLQREKYIRSLVEQVKESSNELDQLSIEYNSVTATLKDMDEIENLPEPEKKNLEITASRIISIEGERRDYLDVKGKMSDSQFMAMESRADSIPEAYKMIKEAEDMRQLIKGDLQKLEGEKHANVYRNSELKKEIENYRGMAMISLFAVLLCVVMLLVLQFGFGMETMIGYVIVVVAGALTVTVVYAKYQDATKEISKVQKGINRIILLQNTVKIRYVNNRNLLDYLYTKYNTSSAKELKDTWEVYEEERIRRKRNAENEKQLGTLQKDLLARLRQYQLSDVYVWLHNPLALMDHNEMVEIRHSHIIQRQKLRAQMDHHKHLAKEGEQELKDLIREYPKYANEVVEMLNRYS